MSSFSRPCLSCRGYHGDLLVGSLPVTLFAGGHVFYIQNLGEHVGTGLPYAVHNTYQFSGSAGKRQRLRERFLWNVVRLPSMFTYYGALHRNSQYPFHPRHNRVPALSASLDCQCQHHLHLQTALICLCYSRAIMSNDCA